MPENNANPVNYKTLYPDTLAPDADKATRFLCDFADGGPITVVMIPAEGPGGRGQTFDTGDPKSVDAMRSYIRAHEKQQFQVFWLPNRAGYEHSDVPARDDIIEFRGVVLDFDPDKTVPLEDERLRLREMIDNMIGTDLCVPTSVIDSGNGVQVVFKFVKPTLMPLEDIEKGITQYESMVKALARSFGADKKTCRVNNLFRVPYTYNWPNAAKKNAGRVRSVSGLWHHGGPSTSITNLRRLCVIRPEDLAKPSNDTITDLDGVTEPELVAVLGKPDHLPEHLQTLVRTTPALEKAVKRPVTNPTPGDTSKDDHILCRALVRFNVPPGDIALLLCAYGVKVKRTFQEKRLFSYVAGTVADALQREAIDQGFESPADAAAAQKAHVDSIRAMSVTESVTGLFDDTEIGVIEGLFPSQGMFVVYGASGSGKTFTVLDLCYRVSLGLEWDGRRVAQGAVIYVAAESPRSVRRRLKALLDLHGNSDDFYLVPAVVNMFDGKADIVELKAVIDGIDKPIKMIVFDTLARVMAPGNENTAQDMSTLVKNGDDLRDRYHTLVGWVHHSGKDITAGARGSSALRAATDVEIEIADSKKFAVTKVRDGDQFDREFSLKKVDIGTLADGTVIDTAVVEWKGGTAHRSGNQRERNAREKLVLALEYLGKPSTVKDIADAGKLVIEGFPRSLSHANIRTTIRRAIDRVEDFAQFPSENPRENLYGLLRWTDNSVT
jgi:hypothetical protein